MSIKQLLTQILKRIPQYSNPVSGTAYTTATANAWENTGISVTVPSGHLYLVHVRAVYQNSRPIGIGFHAASTFGAYNAPQYNVQSPIANETIEKAGFILTSGTHYLFTKRTETGSNTHYLYILDFNIAEGVQ